MAQGLAQLKSVAFLNACTRNIVARLALGQSVALFILAQVRSGITTDDLAHGHSYSLDLL